MRLTEFILHNIEPILVEWEAFARGIWPRTDTDPAELRDHAEEILCAIVRDMGTEQTEPERTRKSHGTGEHGTVSQRLDSASHHHGAGRVTSGFKLKELVAEYRALRASVIRLWRTSKPDPHALDLDDLTRFNESIDQSLAQAVESFTEQIDRARQMLLAILGHDLRSPLSALATSAELLVRIVGGDERTEQTTRIVLSSASAMSRMIDDLLDFTGASLRGGLPLAPRPADLEAICREVVTESLAANPDCTINYAGNGDVTGEWDPARLRQVVSNLISNAIQHGGSGTVDVTTRGDTDVVMVAIRNDGNPIPPQSIATIFDPLVRLTSPQMRKPDRPGSMGLGLYIVKEIVAAHAGTIDVTSTADTGTVFTVRLPRRSNPHTAPM